MKTLKCDLCDATAQGDTFEDWINDLKPHYAEVHADFMKQKSAQTKEEQMADMQKWMKENKERYEVAPID